MIQIEEDKLLDLENKISSLEKELDSYKKISADAEAYMRENTILHSENQMAARIQRSMLLPPGLVLQNDELEIYADADFAKSVGGDLYDYFMCDDGRICFYVGDVSGKGVPAVSYMVAAKILIKAKMTGCSDAAEVMAMINKELFNLSRERQFVTMFLCLMNTKTGVIECLNAGHNPAFILKADGKIVKIDTRSGIPLGSYYNENRPAVTAYKSFEFVMEKDDVLYLYTDGCTEAMNAEGEVLGEEAFMNNIASSYQYDNLSDKVRYLQRSIINYENHEEQDDDVTIMGVHYHCGSNGGTTMD